MSHREEQPTEPTTDAPWLPAGDDPGYFAADEPPNDALLSLRVTPQVQIQVTSSYQLTVTVKGGGPAAINPSVLFDAVRTAAAWAAGHEPQPPRPDTTRE